MTTTPKATPRRSSLLWLQGLACGAVATLATPTAILGGILLAPSLLALAFDRSDGKAVGRSVLLCGLAGCVEPIGTLWRVGHTSDVALALATDTRVFVIAWAAQAAGWLLSELTPILVQLAIDGTAAGRAASLKRTRARYLDDWDIAVDVPPVA